MKLAPNYTFFISTFSRPVGRETEEFEEAEQKPEDNRRQEGGVKGVSGKMNKVLPARCGYHEPTRGIRQMQPVAR